MPHKWTLKWGVWKNNNEFTKEQGEDSNHETLDECKAEVKRLSEHYKKLRRSLWFANAKNNDGEEATNLHRQLTPQRKLLNMMNVEQFKAKAVLEIETFIPTLGMDGCFVVSFDEIFSDDADKEEHISGSVKIEFKYKNCQRTHIINFGCDDVDGFGLEDHEGEINELSHTGLMRLMYFDLALSDLADEHLI
jgi:hypothetical protein